MQLYSPWFLQDGSRLQSIILAFLLSTLTFLVFRSSYFRFRAYSNRRKPRLPPSPPGLPLIGNLHQLGPLPHRTLRALSQKHGPLMLLHLGQVPTLVVSSAEAAREVMKVQDLAFATRPFSKPMHVLTYRSCNIGFAPYGEHWRQAKKAAVVHLLGPKRVQSFRRVREEQVVLMVEKVAAASSPASTVDMSEVFRSFAISVVSKVVIGNCLARGERAGVFEQMMDEIGELMEGFKLDAVFPSVGRWLEMLPGVDSKLRKLFERWDAFHNQIFEEREQRRAQQGDEVSEGDFVDVLLSMHGDPDTDFPSSRGVIAAVWSELVAVGAETTLATLEWAMAELVKNPHAMERARREVREIIGGKPMGTEDDVARMSYLKAVIKEALRLHTPAPLLLPRESMKDAQVLGYDVPRKTSVLINAWAISRDPSYREAPEEFQPERFLDSAIDFRGKDFQFIPFGAGRRICPGINFSMHEIELALANLLHRFDWCLPRGMRVEDFEMGETPGIVVRLKPRLRLVAIPCTPTLVSSDVGI